MLRIQSFLGIIVIALIAWFLSENRAKVRWRDVVIGIALQITLAVVLLKVPLFREFFVLLNTLVSSLEVATKAGTSFVFGYLGGGTLPFDEKFPGSSFILGLQALPLVLIVSALSSLLFYWRILPVIVRAFSFVLEKTLNIGGALGLSSAADIFVGMIEAPLIVKPYLRRMTRSELFSTMTCGMATIAGTVMVLYASILGRIIPDAMGHILIASIINTPAALTIARLMIPETGERTAGRLAPPQAAASSMDAVTRGTVEGLTLLLNIVAMLIVLVALVHLANLILGLLPLIGGEPITLQRILGYIMAPLVWLMGIPWFEATTAGALMGTKTILNEFLAYMDLANLPEAALSPRSRMIMVYALCGFANLGSLGIMIGGYGSMVAERKDEVVSLGMKVLLSGTLATCLTGAVIGLF
ncbi:MAG: NupC/NupG family nucleoside CNT transporter [bacterium]